MLMVSLAPLLIGSFAFNFNNFVVVEFLTQGGPPILDAAVPVGLDRHPHNVHLWGRGVSQDAATTTESAAAITILIFLILVIISSISFRFTRSVWRTSMADSDVGRSMQRRPGCSSRRRNRRECSVRRGRRLGEERPPAGSKKPKEKLPPLPSETLDPGGRVEASRSRS